MTGLEIGLIIVGILVFVGSFLVSEKLSSSDMKEITRISEDEVKNIVSKQVAMSEDTINERLNARLEDAVNDFAIRTDDEYVSKMNQINEYSEKVLSTMDKTNNEIVFIHSMLNDKQKIITEMTTELDTTKSQLLQLKSDVDKRLDELKIQYDETIKLKKDQEFISGIDMIKVDKETVKSFEDELVEKINEDKHDAPIGLVKAVSYAKPDHGKDIDRTNESIDDISEKNVSNDNDIENEIVSLYKEGFSEIDIAKRYGKGIGEIKLILGLYN